MSDRNSAEGVPPGWLFDAETGRTRWWDGARWTDLVKPLDPVVRTSPAYTPVAVGGVAYSGAPSSRNAAATAAMLFVVLSALALAAGIWLTGGLDPSAITVLAVINGLLVTLAFALSVAALVISIQRPTRKAVAIVALIASSLLLSVLIFRLLDGFAG
jgi:hypothetical protein